MTIQLGSSPKHLQCDIGRCANNTRLEKILIVLLVAFAMFGIAPTFQQNLSPRPEEIEPPIIKKRTGVSFQNNNNSDDDHLGLGPSLEGNVILSNKNKNPKEGFDAKHAPIMRIGPTVDKPVRIRVLSFTMKKKPITFRSDNTTWTIGDEVLNICMDGFQRSPYFELLDHAIIPDDPAYYLQEDDNVVWVVDMRRFTQNKIYSTIEQVANLVNQTLRYQQETFSSSTKQQQQPSLKVVLMDYRDRGHLELCRYRGTHSLMQMLGKENVRQVQQQIVVQRMWDDKQQFPSKGKMLDPHFLPCFEEVPSLHVPYTVRSDYAIAVEENYTSMLGSSSSSFYNSISTTSTPSDTLRPMDVAHYWRVNSEKHANLRNEVTRLILSLNQTSSKKLTIQVFGDLVSEPGRVGRTLFQTEYIKALLSTKIVVVAQRDSWEDHYRLFEAIIGGALVMTDPMLSLPDGYVDRESIVIYKSLDHLRELILYYLDPNNTEERLEIARKGWRLAMNCHRTFHWMEKLFFGKPLTVTSV
jgi:hypothetical protein